MNTPSLESMSEEMTGIKWCCDIAHMSDEAIKNPLVAGLDVVITFL